MTCNPKWIEITEELKSFEEAENRLDLVAIVFRSKLEHLTKEVIKEELFGPIATYTRHRIPKKRPTTCPHVINTQKSI